MPEGQSFYEDHGVKVCLSCFRDTPRCKKCKFPSNDLEIYPGLGPICEFCKESVENTGMVCYTCQKAIPAWMSHYADYGKTVCQECFAEADRCFLCRFPNSVEKIPQFGHICEFCTEDVIQESSDLDSFLNPIKTFLGNFGHTINELPEFQWTDWNLILGMQIEGPLQFKIKFFDEYLRYGYPIFFLKNRIYLIRRITRAYFLPHMAGQLVAADLCETYQQPHLMGESPFAKMARGWCHWIAFSTAKLLKYSAVQKQLNKWPEPNHEDFQKFIAMSEFRKPKEIVKYAHSNLKEYALKYL